MKTTFFAAEPHGKARWTLDSLLTKGESQIAIACAFLTRGGVEVLRPHAQRLKLPDSFLVVANDNPTDRRAVGDLYQLAPDRIYTHLGFYTPKERKVGCGLMHSKVFFARAGTECWLWVGSHNLTASATQGVNCEAAVVMEGSVNEPIFQEALAHLRGCRDEAVLFDPLDPPPPPKPRDVLVIHAERHASVERPTWFVHLLTPTEDYDDVLRPPAAVWLYLYPENSLRRGAPRPSPIAAFSGAITALNYTEYHRDPGISATWESAKYVIAHEAGRFKLAASAPRPGAPTQCVFRIDQEENPSTTWVTEDPTPRLERIIDQRWTEEVDPDFAKFFTRDSLSGGRLHYQLFGSQRRAVHVREHELGSMDSVSQIELPSNVRLQIESDEALDDVSEFLYRAKYRLS